MESTLTLKKSDLEAKVGDFLGYGRGAPAGEQAWDTRQKNTIKDCLDSGVRRVYWPELVDGQQYSWSFLRPNRSVTLHTGAQAVTLWDDFGGLDEDRITVAVAGSATVYRVLTPTNPEKVRIAYSANPSEAGQPVLCGVQALEGVRNDGSSRKQLVVFPAADQDYTLTFALYLRPGALSDDYPYVYGGPELSELFLESCLAVAEQRRDDLMGVHTAKYGALLAAAISADRRMRPQNYGRNTDHSDARHLVRPRGARGWEHVLQSEGTVITTSLTGGN